MITVTVAERKADPNTGNTVLRVRVLDFDPAQLSKGYYPDRIDTHVFDGLASEDDIARSVAQLYPDSTVYGSVDERYRTLVAPALLAAGLREYTPDGAVVMTPLAENIDSITEDFLATLPPRASAEAAP